MTLEVVRNMTSNRTHLMEVEDVVMAHQFGATYEMPVPGEALCGVSIEDGVVMQAGTKVKCRPCRWIEEHFMRRVTDLPDIGTWEGEGGR